MKEIKSSSLSEIILIASREKFEEDYPLFLYIGKLKGSNGLISTTVHVMFLNCENVQDIPRTVDLEIKSTKEYVSQNPENKEPLLSQAESLLNLRKEIENPYLRHDPSEELINFISDKISCKLKREQVIFLSGVSSLVEV
jgi:hypothetical protein